MITEILCKKSSKIYNFFITFTQSFTYTIYHTQNNLSNPIVILALEFRAWARSVKEETVRIELLKGELYAAECQTAAQCC